MKRNLMAVAAVVIAIAASSFTTKKVVNVYFIYQSGTERDITHYTQQSPTAPATDPGTSTLNWFKIADNNGTVTNAEFNTAFDGYDSNLNSSLDDEAEITGSLDKK